MLLLIIQSISSVVSSMHVMQCNSQVANVLNKNQDEGTYGVSDIEERSKL
jgi:hypothetical protein